MKCPKCGFISFDFNQFCPKCNRELADEQIKLNLPFFRPDPPQLLGILTGEAFDSETDIQSDESDLGEESIQELYLGPEDSLVELEEDQPIEDQFDSVSLEPDESVSPPSLPKLEHEDYEPTPDLEDISKEKSENVLPVTEQKEEDLFDLLIENGSDAIEAPDKELPIDSETSKNELTKVEKENIEEEEEISLPLDDISFEDLEIEEAVSSESVNIEPDDAPVTDINFPKDSGTMESFYLDNNAEGLTKEIDMKKFKKLDSKKDDKAEY